MKKLVSIIFIVSFFSGCHCYAQWDGSSEPWTQGSGTQSNPYIISSPGMLAYLSDLVGAGINNFEGQYFLLSQDINLNNYLWTPIGNDSYSFQGNFNGGGHTISNIRVDSISSPNIYGGLFGSAHNSNFSSLILQGTVSMPSNPSQETKVGGLVGSCTGNITISDVVSYMTITAIGDCNSAGGIVGQYHYTNSSGITMNKCSNYGSITISSSNYFLPGSTVSCGGIIGNETGPSYIQDCANYGNLLISHYSPSSSYAYDYCQSVGGIAGQVNGVSTISICKNLGNIAFQGDVYLTAGSSNSNRYYSGGVLGHIYNSNTSSVHIDYCYNIGDVQTSDRSGHTFNYASGICYNATNVKGCYNVGSLTATNINGISGSSTHSYYLNNCGATLGGIARTELQMKSISFPTMLNIDSTVYIVDNGNTNGGYPIFRIPVTNVTTDSASDIGSYSSMLNGHYDGHGDTVGFIYRQTSCDAPMSRMILNTTSSQVSYSLTSLLPNTQYCYAFFVKYNGSYIYGDTLTFTTYPTHAVTLSANNNTWGRVLGGGTFGHGDSCTIVAIPDSTVMLGYIVLHYNFIQWSDGNTSNPRVITVLSDTTLTAQFALPNYTLTITPNNPSWGMVNGSGTYPAGTTYIASAVPSTGYHFHQWTNSSNSWGNMENPLIGNIWYDMHLIAEFRPNQYTVTVQTNDSTMGIVEGGGVFNYNQQTYIIARPFSSSIFTQWSDGDTNQSRIITVTDNVTYTAFFTDRLFNIIAQSDNPLFGYVTGGGSYARGSHVELEAIPNTGYHFTHWSDGNIDNPRIVTVTSDASFTAHFAINTYNVNVGSNNTTMGVATGGGVFSHGTIITLEATPMPHHRFIQWNDGSNENPRTITVISDSNFTAQFEQQEQYTIFVVSDNPNQGVVNGGGRFYAGENIVISAIPLPNYIFRQWSDGDTNSSHHITVVSDATYTAYFGGIQYTVNVYSNDDNMGNVTGGGSFEYGDYATVTATPSPGYQFLRWSNGVEVNPYTFQVSSNVNLIAYFEPFSGVERMDELYCYIKTNGLTIIITGIENIPVIVTDMLGRTIYKSKSFKQTPIEVHSNGVYMVRIGNNYTKKIILIN